MSRNLAAITAGSSNRRFIMLAVALGLLGAILVYVAASRGDSSSGGGLAATPVMGGRPAPPDGGSQFAYEDAAAVVGEVTRFPIAANEQVLTTKVVPLSSASSASSRSLSFVVPQGMRGIAVSTSEVTGAGGLVLPGDYVDVLIIYDVEFRGGDGRQTAENFK